MARYLESACRLCRREGIKLFLKGGRCYTEKCAIERRAYAPGQHGQRRTKNSEYATQLREKQKMKRLYGLLERQFRHYFRRAERMRGISGENLLLLLERRLDNMVYRFGFASSRAEARQLINHGHFQVNGKKVDIASYLVDVGDKIQVKERSRSVVPIVQSMEAVERRGVPAWLQLDRENFIGVIQSFPAREELTMPMQEQLVVELYSK
ncbi:MAG: 30S ribosomal protein S4 [Deltaproteobacteria bacterium]|nr:30S ribosomal protein S4 [Deltaproteobacteria bacterium]